MLLIFSKTLNLELLEREFSSSSIVPGIIGFLVTTLPFDTRPQVQTGKLGGHIQGFSFFLNALFTILSSRE
jgi:hypothetical protein